MLFTIVLAVSGSKDGVNERRSSVNWRIAGESSGPRGGLREGSGGAAQLAGR